jgi:hypothetical protein
LATVVAEVFLVVVRLRGAAAAFATLGLAVIGGGASAVAFAARG